MSNNRNGFIPMIDFAELTPDMQIGAAKNSPNYEKAFLCGNDEGNGEFSRNTAAED